MTGSVAWFASHPQWGTHDLKGGFERFVAIGRGGNSQSSTGFIFNTDYLTASGRPVFDAAGKLIPVWIPNATHAGDDAADARRAARHHDHARSTRRTAGPWRAG